MADNLRQRLAACADADIEVAGTTVTCWFGVPGESRRHSVRVSDGGDSIHMEATIVGASRLEALEELGKEPDLYAWSLNRASHIVGFRVDRQGRLIAESTAPKAGLTNDELRVYLRLTAAAADRLELVLTGRDS